jgi:hypothetical protein
MLEPKRDTDYPHDGAWNRPDLADRPWWPRHRVDLMEGRLELMHRCLGDGPGGRPECVRGHVYLMWCPSLKVYRIGRSRRRRGKRLREHWRLFDNLAENRVVYGTPVNLFLFEKALHHHFSDVFHPGLGSREVFDLSPEEEAGFWDTAKTVERYLLAIEILRLERLLQKLKAQCPEAS